MAQPVTNLSLGDLVENAHEGVWLLDANSRTMYVNEQMARMLGSTADALRGRAFHEFVHERAPLAGEDEPKLALLEMTQPKEVRLKREDGSDLWVSLKVRGLPDGNGCSSGSAVLVLDLSTQKQEQEALRESERRFRMTVSNSPGIIFYQDTDFKITWVSKPPPPKPDIRVIGVTDLAFVGSDESARLREIKRRVMETGVGERTETVTWIDGNPLYLELAYEQRVDEDGKVIGLIGYARNMTDRKLAEDQLRALNETLEQRVAERTAALQARSEELASSQGQLRESEKHYRELADYNRRLVRELEHRVRNNLSGLLGLIAAMRQTAQDVGAFADAIEGRLRAMADVHRLLATTGWRAVDLRNLITHSLGAMQHLASWPAAQSIEGPPISVSPRRVVPLSLILVEWFTNSCKYGAHSRSGGKLEVTWEPHDGLVRLTWQEHGGPPVRESVIPSLGSELVNGFATRELGGHCETHIGPDGATHVLEFVADDMRDRETLTATTLPTSTAK